MHLHAHASTTTGHREWSRTTKVKTEDADDMLGGCRRPCLGLWCEGSWAIKPMSSMHLVAVSPSMSDQEPPHQRLKMSRVQWRRVVRVALVAWCAV